MSQTVAKHWILALRGGKRQDSYSQIANKSYEDRHIQCLFPNAPIIKTCFARCMYHNTEAGGRGAPHHSTRQSLSENEHPLVPGRSKLDAVSCTKASKSILGRSNNNCKSL